jgi:hypothetical protein
MRKVREVLARNERVVDNGRINILLVNVISAANENSKDGVGLCIDENYLSVYSLPLKGINEKSANAKRGEGKRTACPYPTGGPRPLEGQDVKPNDSDDRLEYGSVGLRNARQRHGTPKYGPG